MIITPSTILTYYHVFNTKNSTQIFHKKPLEPQIVPMSTPTIYTCSFINIITIINPMTHGCGAVVLTQTHINSFSQK